MALGWRTAWVSRMPLKLVSLSIGRSWLIVGAAFFSASVRSCAVTFSGPSVSRPHGLTAMPPTVCSRCRQTVSRVLSAVGLDGENYPWSARRGNTLFCRRFPGGRFARTGARR